MGILRFDKYNEISSSKIRINKVKESSDEICYEASITINGNKIEGQIFTEKNGDLECYQFYDKNGIDIDDVYGHDILEKIIKEKLKKIR
jgi:hypothetical protein